MSFEYRYRIVKCQCGEEILVERVLFGIDHTADIIASHKDCLKKKGVDPKFEKEHPKEAKELREWLGLSVNASKTKG